MSTIQKKVRDGVPLSFHDNESRKSALVLIHGWGCDHTTLLQQQAFFSDTHRVVNVDLRGHGESGSPKQIYSVAQFADDLAWLCQELGIQRAALIGHSMGGAVALETASRFPELVGAACLIDTAFQAPLETQKILAPLLPGLQSNDYENAYRKIMIALSLTSDREELRPVLSTLPRAPQHVLLSALQEHMERHDFAKAAASCSVPVAYIGASVALANLEQLKQLIPDIRSGQTLGSGHFSPWLVPEQVNAMLRRFLDLIQLDGSATRIAGGNRRAVVDG